MNEKIYALIPRGLHERKAPHGKPCTSCGLCCMVSLCQLGQHVLGRPELPGPCPALVLDDAGKSSCGLIVDPVKFDPVGVEQYGATEMSRAAAHLISAGRGCDMTIVGEPFDAAYDAQLESEARRDHWLNIAARVMWRAL